MAENTDLDAALYAYHEPDPGPPPDHVRPETVELGAGFIVVGVTINGRRLPLGRFKADDILTAQSDQQQPQSR